jgi:hypothetical protein
VSKNFDRVLVLDVAMHSVLPAMIHVDVPIIQCVTYYCYKEPSTTRITPTADTRTCAHTLTHTNGFVPGRR